MSSNAQQAPGIERTDLQQHDISAPGRQVIQNRVEIGPEALPYKHFHYGEEIIYSSKGNWSTRSKGSRRGRSRRERR